MKEIKEYTAKISHDGDVRHEFLSLYQRLTDDNKLLEEIGARMPVPVKYPGIGVGGHGVNHRGGTKTQGMADGKDGNNDHRNQEQGLQGIGPNDGADA